LSQPRGPPRIDFFELPGAGLGTFDFVLFLGVLYHLRHPLLALEIVCGLTAAVAIVESFITDGDSWQNHLEDIPTMEFYETDELGGQLDNWVGPTLGCLLAMCRAAGFARVELLHTEPQRATLACYRKWEPPLPKATVPTPELIAVMNNRNYGINFSTRKEEYISCWFRCSRANLEREELRLEVGEFGVPALYIRAEGGGVWLANFRFPPGLTSGWQPVRLRLADSGFSNSVRIAVDMPVEADELVVEGVCDGLTWTPGEVEVRERGFVSCWVKGLGENCDRSNVRLYLGGARLRVEYIGEPGVNGFRQINGLLPGDIAKGEAVFRVEFGGIGSEPLRVEVK